jgi:hypothetical protein
MSERDPHNVESRSLTETGESQVGVRALVQQEGRERALTISTHKRGDLVQLIVEDDG